MRDYCLWLAAMASVTGTRGWLHMDAVRMLASSNRSHFVFIATCSLCPALLDSPTLRCASVTGLHCGIVKCRVLPAVPSSAQQCPAVPSSAQQAWRTQL